MNRFHGGLLLALVWLLGATTDSRGGEYSVAPSGRHMLYRGEPFFWLGDTAWLLAQVPSREEVDEYLQTRAEQGFTVIQLTAVMAEERVWGTLKATTRGDVPFENGDVLKPAVTPGNDPQDPAQYDYWDHLDFVLERIRARGLHAALVVDFVGWSGEGYKYLKPENAEAYGRFLGERYREKPGMIWILGGDNTPDTEVKKAVWPALARGLATGWSGREDHEPIWMTYHINGGASSAQIWHEAEWLDFNMAQTWSAYTEIYAAVVRDYQRVPAKPCGLGEGAYEDGPQYPTKPIDGWVIRKQACWSYLAGGYHTYGNGNVWHFDSFKPELTQTWKEALRSPGAESLRHVRRLLENVRWWEYEPDPALTGGMAEAAKTGNVAMRRKDGGALLAYVCSSPATLQLGAVSGPARLQGDWINAATGEKAPAKAVEGGVASFTLPQGWTDGFLYLSVSR